MRRSIPSPQCLTGERSCYGVDCLAHFYRGAWPTFISELTRAVQGTHPALEALEHVSRVGAHRRRVTRRRQTLADEAVEAPLDHITERWRRLVFEGKRGLNAAFYELAAFEALKD